jgi:hypothetical protein
MAQAQKDYMSPSTSPTTVPKLIQAVHEAWDALAIPDIDKYIHSMPKRVQAILEASGAHTRF